MCSSPLAPGTPTVAYPEPQCKHTSCLCAPLFKLLSAHCHFSAVILQYPVLSSWRGPQGRKWMEEDWYQVRVQGEQVSNLYPWCMCVLQEWFCAGKGLAEHKNLPTLIFSGNANSIIPNMKPIHIVTYPGFLVYEYMSTYRVHKKPRLCNCVGRLLCVSRDLFIWFLK